MENENQGFRINAGSPTAIVGMLAFALSVPMQILGYADRLNDPIVAGALVFLPVLSAVLMIFTVLKYGKNAFWLSVFPVFIGVLGFAFKLFIDPRGTSILHHAAAIVLYVAIVTLWALTVLYVIRTKWVLVTLFLLPLLKHVFLDDLPVLLGAAAQVSSATWLKEISMLSFMLALTFYAVSLEKKQLSA